MPAYRYEVHRDDQVATGHLNHEQALRVGKTLTIGGRLGLIRSIEPQLHQRELQVIVQLGPGSNWD